MPEPFQTPKAPIAANVQEPPKSTKLEMGPQLTLPYAFQESEYDFKDFTRLHSTFLNGIAPSTQLSKGQAERDQELQTVLSKNAKPWNEAYPSIAPPSDGFGVKVGGTSIPLSTGLSVWDLRSSVIDQLNQNGSPIERNDASQMGPSSQAQQFGDRYDIKGPKFGLSWTARF